MELKEITISNIGDMFRNFGKKISNITDPTETDRLMAEISIETIHSKSSTLLNLPHQNTRWVNGISKKDGSTIFVIIEFGVLTIVNGSFSYIRNMPDITLREIIGAFNLRMEGDINDWKKIIEEKNNNNLSAILNKIKQ
jgi:hypothetical protein